MFRHILVPTDGSTPSDKAVTQAVAFARSIQARLTFFYAEPDESASLLGEGELLRTIDPEILARSIRQHVQEVLEKARAIAEAVGVPCEVAFRVSNEPFEAIIAEAGSRGCDLILMASHGYRGVKGLLLGSQTQKVLTHSKIPVLVYR